MTHFEILKIGLKREYWENKRMLFVVPIVLSVIIFVAAFAAQIYASHIHEWALEKAQVEQSTAPSDQPESALGADAHDNPNIEIEIQDTPFEFVAIYMSLGWFIGLYYLLSSLFSDRRDNSILYWKSLPVSETQQVFTKLLFGSVAFALVAMAAAWLMYGVLAALGWGAMETDEAGKIVSSPAVFDPLKLIVWPLHGVLAGALWGLPVFAYFLFISAYAKRSRFLWLIGPLAVIIALEGIVFRSNVFTGFFIGHMPHRVLELLVTHNSLAQFWQSLLGPSLFIGLIVGFVLLAVTIWLRNHRFEA